LKSKKEKVIERLLAFGFVKPQCLYILKNFEFQRVVDVTNYFNWLKRNKPSKDHTQKYFYFLLKNFDFDKTWAEYQRYYNEKKNTASLDFSKKKKYLLSGKKVGKDGEVDKKPKNVIDFIKNGTKSENTS